LEGYPKGSSLFKGLVDRNGQHVFIGVDLVKSYYLGEKDL